MIGHLHPRLVEVLVMEIYLRHVDVSVKVTCTFTLTHLYILAHTQKYHIIDKLHYHVHC